MTNDVIPARPRDPDLTPDEINTILDTIVSSIDQNQSIERAILQVIINEFNRHSILTAAILNAAASATSLADFKSQMAVLNAIPKRSFSDLRTAVRAIIGT